MDSVSAKELFVLGRLSARPTHGHEIMRTLSESKADLWVELSEKHVYYILRKLERDGLVVADAPHEGGRPARKVFSITPAGQEAFARMMTAESLIESVPYSEFDVVFGMLAYTDALTDDQKTSVLERRRVFLRTLASQAQEAGAAAVRGDLDGLPRLVLDKLTRVTVAELGWLDGVVLEIERAGWAAMRPRFADSRQAMNPNEGVSQ
jgi:DNA-binding PadR family transcriptional regulator